MNVNSIIAPPPLLSVIKPERFVREEKSATCFFVLLKFVGVKFECCCCGIWGLVYLYESHISVRVINNVMFL